MIETWNLGKTFRPAPWPISLAGRRLARPVRALHAINLRVERGEIFGLLGPNGAGKTTLLKVLATLVLPSEGGARVDGADVVRDAGAVRRAIGLVTGQERGFYWRLSGEENLEFFAGVLGFGPGAARRQAQRVLETVELLAHGREVVERYSTGMRQRLGIARALLGDPQVLLLDEPTRSLDAKAVSRTHGLIRSMTGEAGKTVLLATHDLSEAATLCHRAAVLVDGVVRDTVSMSSAGETGLAERYRALLEGPDDASLPALGLS